MNKFSIQNAEQFAKEFRVKFGYGLGEPINLKSLLNKLNVLAVFKGLSNNFSGLSLRTNALDYFMLINSNMTKGRQHFTIAHELYHLIYDEKPKPHVCNELYHSEEIVEINADRFASALLMPEVGIYNFLESKNMSIHAIDVSSLLMLEHYFSVSHQALLMRLKLLKIISNSQYRDFNDINPIESAMQYGYDLALYKKGNQNLIIGNFGIMARTLYDQEKISEGHYQELINLIANYDETDHSRC